MEAKKFVESAPQELKAEIEKDEAEKIAQLITDNGGTTEIK